jgi:tetratricopeptide (TPR) repeat protein
MSVDLGPLWNFGDPAGSEARFAALGVEVTTQIARAQGLQRRFDDAHATLDGVEALATSGKARVRYLLERGRVFNSSGDKAQARPLFIEAIEAAKEAGEDGLAVDAAHMVAIVEEGDAALDWNFKALALAEASEAPAAKKWRGSLYNNIGWTLHGLDRFEEALGLFERALTFRQEAGAQNSIWVAQWCVARCLRSLGRLDEALAQQQTLRAEREAGDAPGGYNYEELGELLLAKGDAAAAAPWFAKAHGLLSQDGWLVANEAGRLSRLAELGGA